MVDKKLEYNIKKTETFLEFWTKFHELYKDAVSCQPVSESKIEMFITTIKLVNSRFEDFMDMLDLTPKERIHKSYPFYEILSVNDVSGMSDEKGNKLNDCWTDSYIFLYALLDKFKKKKKRIEKYNRFFFLTKKLVTRGGKR